MSPSVAILRGGSRQVAPRCGAVGVRAQVRGSGGGMVWGMAWAWVGGGGSGLWLKRGMRGSTISFHVQGLSGWPFLQGLVGVWEFGVGVGMVIACMLMISMLYLVQKR